MPVAVLHFNTRDLAKGLQLTEEEVVRIFRNGKNVSEIIERRIANIEKLRMPASRNDACDCYGSMGGLETRCLTEASGTHFGPSGSTGKGRVFTQETLFEKLRTVIGFYIADVALFPEVPYWKVSSQLVSNWWHQGELGKIAKVSREKMLSLLAHR